jgi:type VI secretion system protein ImpK
LQTLASRPIAEDSGASFITLAMPLLQLMARLRTMASQPDPSELRARVEAELRAFQGRAEKAGLPADLIRRAHYVLCASLDDIVLNTPWGAHGAWAEQSLVAIFHPTVGADRYFDVLRQAQEKADTFRPVLELFHVCLSLGVQGRHRGAPNGAAELEQVRANAAAALAARAPPVAPELSAHWQGVAAPFMPGRARFPLWVAASIGLALLAGLFLYLNVRLNEESDSLFAAMLGAPPSHMPVVSRQPVGAALPPPLPAAEPTAQDRLSARLQPAIAAGQVVVAGTPVTPVLRVPAHLLFAANSATLLAEAQPILESLAAAVTPDGGTLRVLGYTDNRPIHTVQFPSLFQLSQAQARAVAAALDHALGGGAHVAAEGRAGADPLVGNTTAEGREQNRRIEIVLEHPGS